MKILLLFLSCASLFSYAICLAFFSFFMRQFSFSRLAEGKRFFRGEQVSFLLLLVLFMVLENFKDLWWMMIMNANVFKRSAKVQGIYGFAFLSYWQDSLDGWRKLEILLFYFLVGWCSFCILVLYFVWIRDGMGVMGHVILGIMCF